MTLRVEGTGALAQFSGWDFFTGGINGLAVADLKGDTITDFAGGDLIRVVGLSGPQVSVSWAAGILSIDPDGMGRKAPTTLHLDGVFDNDNFHVAADGNGNTLITYTPEAVM